MDACGSAPASGLSCFVLVLFFLNCLSITLFLVFSFLGEVVVHEDVKTKTHGDTNIFELCWFFMLMAEPTCCCLIYECLYFVCQEMLWLSLFVIYVVVE